MFIVPRTENPPARFGGAEVNLTSTNPGSFRLSEPRLGLRRYRSINISHLRSEELSRLIIHPDEQESGSRLSDSGFFRQSNTQDEFETLGCLNSGIKFEV